MSFFHKHEWEIVSKTYQPSLIESLAETGRGLKSVSFPWGEDYAASFTSHLMLCKTCPATKTVVMQGKIV